mmetsp:Transcript_5704/g.16897  ORF Transcript_5704/g.16897 Transcript_5704/m.16897 type:complete len:97 (-) Transcript_5704:361-651(-)
MHQLMDGSSWLCVKNRIVITMVKCNYTVPSREIIFEPTLIYPLFMHTCKHSHQTTSFPSLLSLSHAMDGRNNDTTIRSSSSSPSIALTMHDNNATA